MTAQVPTRPTQRRHAVQRARLAGPPTRQVDHGGPCPVRSPGDRDYKDKLGPRASSQFSPCQFSILPLCSLSLLLQASMAPPKWAPVERSPKALRRALSVDRGDLPEIVGAPLRSLPVAPVVTTAVTTTVSPPTEPVVAAEVQEQAKDPVVATEGPELTVETPVVGSVTEPSSTVSPPAEAAAAGAPLVKENILQVWQAELEGSRLRDRSGVPSGIPEDIFFYSPGDSLFPGSPCLQPLRCCVDRRRGPTTRSHQKLWRNYLKLQRRHLQLQQPKWWRRRQNNQSPCLCLHQGSTSSSGQLFHPPSSGPLELTPLWQTERQGRPTSSPMQRGCCRSQTEQVKTLVVAGTPFPEYVKEGKPLFRQPPVELPLPIYYLLHLLRTLANSRQVPKKGATPRPPKYLGPAGSRLPR